jgi:cytochrome c-type biogenesis protein
VSARLAGAFLAGFVSFVSPCFLPLVPGYLAAISAHANGPEDARVPMTRALASSAWFAAGFTGIFVLVGAGAGVIGADLPVDPAGMRAITGFILVILGLSFAGALPSRADIVPPSLLDSVRRRRSPVLLGAAFAVCAAPCIGPILGATLIVGGSSGTVGASATTLFAYSLGLATPFLLTAVALGQVMPPLRRLRNWFFVLRAIGGTVLIATGVLLFIDRAWWLNVGAHRLQELIGLP